MYCYSQLSNYWGTSAFLETGVFKKLKEPNAFKQVHVSFDTVEWDSGADLDPEFVYSKCHSKQQRQQAIAS